VYIVHAQAKCAAEGVGTVAKRNVIIWMIEQSW